VVHKMILGTRSQDLQTKLINIPPSKTAFNADVKLFKSGLRELKPQTF